MVSAASLKTAYARVGKAAYPVLAVLSLLAVLGVIYYTLHLKINRIDFDVFFLSGRMVLHGMPPYTYYGKVHLPFWYFPWTAWVFIPLAWLPQKVAWYIYLAGGVSAAFITIFFLARHYHITGAINLIFICSAVLWLSWLTIYVGQMSFFLFVILVGYIFLVHKRRFIIAGLLFPLLLIKPHLVIIFIPLVLLLTGKKTFIVASLVTLALLAVETLITPNWPQLMVNLLTAGTQRVDTKPFWDFTTFPTLIGFTQNYAGTASLPLTGFLVVVAALVIYRFRRLPVIPLLSFALAASLFCAPRSYSYDQILIVPAMFWLSEGWNPRAKWFWASAILIPLVSHYSAGAYLLTLLVFISCIVKAYRLEKASGAYQGVFRIPTAA